MQTMEQSLADLTSRRVITADVAFSRSSRPEQLRGILERAGFANLPETKSTQSGLRLAGEV
jgi:hypothetical protein